MFNRKVKTKAIVKRKSPKLSISDSLTHQRKVYSKKYLFVCFKFKNTLALSAAKNKDNSKEIKVEKKKIEMYEETEGTQRYNLIQEM